MRLNLGCGDDVRPGYENVDIRQTRPEVHVVDLSFFPWPWPPAEADEIMMLDFLEHFPYAQTETILRECVRILKPGGRLIVQVPDFDHVARAIVNMPPFMCNSCGHRFNAGFGTVSIVSDEEAFGCPGCGSTYPQIADAGVARLFGGQDYAGNWHQTAFDKKRLQRLCCSQGLKFLQWLEDDHQRANWNIKGEFVR